MIAAVPGHLEGSFAVAEDAPDVHVRGLAVVNITDDVFTIVRVYWPQGGVIQAHQHGILFPFACRDLLNAGATPLCSRTKPNL